MRLPSRRYLPVAAAAVVIAMSVAACGTESIDVPSGDPAHRGATLFAERCSGCHTMTPAGAQGSANRALRVQGPSLDQRHVSYEDALFAIQNGGFSGAIMPQNIVVGEEARAVARFIAEYSGQDVAEAAPTPDDQAEEEGEDARATSEQQPAGQAENE